MIVDLDNAIPNLSEDYHSGNDNHAETIHEQKEAFIKIRKHKKEKNQRNHHFLQIHILFCTIYNDLFI